MMNRVAQFVVERAMWAWLLAAIVIVSSILLAGRIERNQQEQVRQTRLKLDVETRAVELMTQTLNGNQMGAIGLLALIDETSKREARNQQAPNSKGAATLMENIARRHDADGMYIVGEDGIIKSSWGVGSPLTGVDVRFRPYFQTAMKGKDNVYAAIGTTTGRRNLYYATPLYAGPSIDTPVIGAVVMRTGVVRLDKQIAAAGDLALLLSPQGLAFAASREEWIGHLGGTATPQRIQEIRKLRQFGRMFDNVDPTPLPFSVEPGITMVNDIRHAVVRTPVNWVDPSGDWTLVVLEDLSRSVPLAGRLRAGFYAGLVALFLSWTVLHLLRARHRQWIASNQLAAYARQQEVSVQRKARLAEASAHMQRSRTHAELIRVFFEQAHELLGVLQGVLYTADASDKPLRLAGSYACADQPPETLTPGEGLLGQCAIERRTQIIVTDTERFAMVRSGLGDCAPAAVLIAPLQLNDMLLGVVEMALLRNVDEADRTQFEELLGLLAMNIEIIGRSIEPAPAPLAGPVPESLSRSSQT